VVKSDNNASLSKASRNAASLRLRNIESPATKVLSKNAKFLLLITVLRTGPEKCTLLQIYLEYNITSHKERILDCVWNVKAHAQKPDFAFRQNGRVRLNRRGASVQSATGSRGARISLQGLYCSCEPVFCSHVTLTGYPLHPRFPFTSPPVRHRVPSHFKRSLPPLKRCGGHLINKLHLKWQLVRGIMYIPKQLKEVDIYEFVSYTTVCTWQYSENNGRRFNRDKYMVIHICELIAQPYFNTTRIVLLIY